ncbi:hypothetical protein [Zooshikella harenae]|uniref:Uncharacterized protein n=1 Tax=Zooshikella harenae TaxID=2827238 RepID=A0ABS5Z7K5_9GAMM|nr:hypothetical protein [Zooshikella harenae]MBU2710030.1 hypothetical protein [Zooshikella harenae]
MSFNTTNEAFQSAMSLVLGSVSDQNQINALPLLKLLFCVYLPETAKLITNYQLKYSNESNSENCDLIYQKRVIVQPDKSALHHTFYNIPQEAIRYTGIEVHCGQKNEEFPHGLAFRQPTSSSAMLSVKEGISELLRLALHTKPVLPVIVAGKSMAGGKAIRIYRLELSAIQHLSKMVNSGIQQVITDKLQRVFQKKVA